MNESKKITAKQYANIIGLNSRSMFYVNKVICKQTTATPQQWQDEFIQHKLIDKKQ